MLCRNWYVGGVFRERAKEWPVPKDKKKATKSQQPGAGTVKKRKKKGKAAPSKAAKSLKALAANPVVADIVAAALVGMAAALKDSDKARRLAARAGDELDKMAKTSAKQGGAMWDLALNIGRQTLDSLAEEGKRGKRGKSR
ncbi:MAG: hypothetical protein QOF05_279 [Sphingomonadales bacterium]|nr:hypothetical protein [Sphingomonadales bacterium]